MPRPQNDVQVQLPETVLFQELGEEVVILNMSDQHYYSLNETGSLMWKLLLQHSSVSIVADELCSVYEEDRERIVRDLKTLIDELLRAGLVRIQ
jgi:hypothetical protein